MIAALYARYSSDNQREESIIAQLRAGREYCKHKGYQIIKEYADEAKTGTDDNRPAFQQMFKDAKSGLFETVVFHKIDRNARNEYDYYFHKVQLQKYGIHYEYVTQNIDDSPEGQMMESVMVGMAAYYSRNLSKEVAKGMNENAYQGLFNGGVPPLGYKIVSGKYVIDDREATAIKTIFDMYLQGNGYMAIINKLNASGFTTRRGRPFGKNSLHDILINCRYMGRYIFGKNKNTTPSGKRNQHTAPGKNAIIVDDVIPAIISKSDFEKVAEKMCENKRQPGKFTAQNSYLLSGLIYCGECGSAMQGTTSVSKKTGNVHQYYRCGKKYMQGISNCQNKNVRLDALENIVIQKIEEIIFAPESLDALITKVSSAYEKLANNTKVERDALNKKYTSTTTRMDNLYRLIEEGTADDFDKKRLQSVKKEMTDITEQLAKLDNRPAPFLTREQIIESIASYKNAIKNKSAENLRALIQNFVNKVTVSKNDITIQFKIKFEHEWSGRRESNPRVLLGKQALYH